MAETERWEQNEGVLRKNWGRFAEGNCGYVTLGCGRIKERNQSRPRKRSAEELLQRRSIKSVKDTMISRERETRSPPQNRRRKKESGDGKGDHGIKRNKVQAALGLWRIGGQDLLVTGIVNGEKRGPNSKSLFQPGEKKGPQGKSYPLEGKGEVDSKRWSRKKRYLG